MYISGALHGNERLGPNVAYYLIEFLATNFNKDSYITYLLKQREIIITPMTNAYGYFHNTREEKTVDEYGRTSKIDPNRDFPYNNTEIGCMNTVAGRIVYKLFA